MEKVFTRVDDIWLINATTALESMPPDRNAPSGTSDIRRTRTASRSNSMARSPASASLMLILLVKSSDQ